MKHYMGVNMGLMGLTTPLSSEYKDTNNSDKDTGLKGFIVTFR